MFGYLVEEVFLPIVLYALVIGLIFRTAFFLFSIIKSGKGRRLRPLYTLAIFLRAFIPLHKTLLKKPLYTLSRYVFHASLFIVPIWLTGHIALWEESRFEWYWTPIPDTWADGLTILLLVLATFFLLRRLFIGDVRRRSSAMDYAVIIITALPFLSGYLFIHGTLDAIPFFENHLMTIHIFSGELMLVMMIFMFCRTRLDAKKCVGCASCDISCPTGTLTAHETASERIFDYSHYQCICCAACVKTCPENAAQLRHDINPIRFFQVGFTQAIRTVQMKACEQCGAFFEPEPQFDKVAQTIGADYLKICPQCRKANVGRVMYLAAPLTGKQLKASA